MKILYQCNGFLPDIVGGVEVLSAQYLAAMRERGHEVLVVTSRVGSQVVGKYEYQGIPIVKLAFGEVLAAKELSALRALVEEVEAITRSFEPDIIHLNDVQLSGFYFLRRQSPAAYPRLLSLHAPVNAAAMDGLQGRLMKQADRIVAVSASLLADAVAACPEIAPRAETIHNALLAPGLEPRPLPYDPAVLLCIGRVVADKGFDLALQAFAKVRRRRNGLRLVVAGNGNAKKQLRELAATQGLEGEVSFPDWVAPQDVPGLINQATIVLMPSRWREPFGLVALQAAQMARPIIASSRGGLTEVVEDGVSGLLVAAGDVEAIAAAIETLLDQPRLAAELGANARARARRLFSFEDMLGYYENAYAAARAHHAACLTGAASRMQ